jgi:hypothetical protein
VPAYGQFVLLQFQPPGDQFLWPVAILLLDPLTDRLYIRGRESYARIAEEDDAQVVALTVEEFQANAETQGGNSLLTQMESMSNTLRVTDRIPLEVRDFRATLDRLFAVFIFLR